LRHQRFVFPVEFVLVCLGKRLLVRVVFRTHVISVQGACLTFLLPDLAPQVVSALIATSPAKFTPVPVRRLLAYP